MHIAEGILSAPVLLGGAALTAVGVVQGLRRLDPADVPRVGLVSAALFVASLIHVPIGPVSAHLLLHGVAGLLLGWAVFPAMLVALLLQAILFQFGGLTTLGVNTAIMAWPAVLLALAFRRWARQSGGVGTVAAFAIGSMAVVLSGVGAAATMVISRGESLSTAATMVLVAHVPVMIVEGLVCVACVRFLRAVKPQMLVLDKQSELARAA